MEQSVGVDFQSRSYVADNGFKAAVLLGDVNNGIRSRLLEFGLDLLGSADTVCARRERQLDSAVLANLSGCAVDCTVVARLDWRGVGELAGAVRAGDRSVVLHKVGEDDIDFAITIQGVNVNRINKVNIVGLDISGLVVLGYRPLFNYFLIIRSCSEGDFSASRYRFVKTNVLSCSSS